MPWTWVSYLYLIPRFFFLLWEIASIIQIRKGRCDNSKKKKVVKNLFFKKNLLKHRDRGEDCSEFKFQYYC